MHRTIIVALALLFTNALTAQIVGKNVFPLNREYKKGGLFIEPQLNTSIGYKAEGDARLNDSLYQYKEEGKGKIGAGLEIGWFHSYRKPNLIHYLEFAAAYRFLHANAYHKGRLEHLNNTSFYQSKNNFKNQYLAASIRATNATQLGDYSYLSTSLGINYNYLLSHKYEYELDHPTFNETFHNEHSVQLHLKVGVGFRISPNLIAMPTIETPLLSVFPINDFNPAFPFFNTKYHPIYLGIRFMFLREDPLNCNAPVFNG